MSLLAPLYLLGALAIVGPIVFHLIRRTPRGEVPFGSLIFLSASPPTLDKRGRVNRWPLLLLRILALLLLALAFGRPFLRRAASLGDEGTPGRRIAVLIDASASLRRDGLWPLARAAALAAIAEARPEDGLAVFAFDDAPRTLLGFDESARLEPTARVAIARARVEALTPSWGSTDLGRALVEGATAVSEAAEAGPGEAALKKRPAVGRRVVLIGDLQVGSRVEALGGFAWPADVTLDLRPVAGLGSRPGVGTNATPRWLAAPVDEAGSTPNAAGALRVGIARDPGPEGTGPLRLEWVDGTGKPVGEPTEATVPAGESRVVRVPMPAAGRSDLTLRLAGDLDGFDDTLYLAPEPIREATVTALLDDKADDPNGLLYYLLRVFESTPRLAVKVNPVPLATTLGPGGKRPSPPQEAATRAVERTNPLVVLAGETSAANVDELLAMAKGGATIVAVVARPGPSATLGRLVGAPGPIGGEAVERDALLGEIAFDHPLFAPFAGPRFNDFTKVHFWRHRRLDTAGFPAGARVLARFEGGDPAVVEVPVGRGRVVVLASGWGPADGQLARSTKFVPLMAGLLEPDRGEGAEATALGTLVGQRVPLRDRSEAGPVAIRRPDGRVDRLEVAPGERPVYLGADVPGVYQVEAGPGEAPRSFAVNLDPAEGRTTPLGREALEALGCRFDAPKDEAATRDGLRQLQSAELEGRQKLWRPLVVAAIAALCVETLLAGWFARSRSRTPRDEASP